MWWVWLEHLRHSQGYLTAGMLHAESHPCLTIKAWNGRLMIIFLDICLRAYLKSARDAGSDPGVEVTNAALAARSMCAWFDAVERGGRYLSQSEAASIFKFGMTFLKSYSRLGIQSVLSGSRRWKYLPKLHVFLHLCEDMLQSKQNCRHHHCFRDEDHIGLLKRLACRVHKGPLFEFRILTRWLLRLQSWQKEWNKAMKPLGTVQISWCGAVMNNYFLKMGLAGMRHLMPNWVVGSWYWFVGNRFSVKYSYFTYLAQIRHKFADK